MFHTRTGALILAILELIILALTVIGTPIEQFKSKWQGGSTCLTLWGAPSSCGGSNYKDGATGIAAFGCGQRKNNMTGGAVFAIVSIVAVLIVFVYAVMMYLNMCVSYVLPAIFSLLAVATLLVCWACVAGVYNNPMCGGNGYSATKLKNTGFKYGAGFYMIVIAWCLQVIGCIFVFVMMFLK